MVKKIIKKYFSLFGNEERLLQTGKRKWDNLSRENAKHYIWSGKPNPTEKEFRDSGKQDYEDLILKDSFLQQHLQQISARTMLEIGCGIGRMTEYFAKDFQHVKAIDISSEMIDSAKVRLGHMQNIEFIETDGTTIPLSNDSVDFAFSFIVFQHIPSYKIIKKYFCEANRVLRKNGIAKVQLRGLKIAEKNKDEWYYGANYNLKSAQDLAMTTGFHILKYDGVGERYFWLWLKA